MHISKSVVFQEALVIGALRIFALHQGNTHIHTLSLSFSLSHTHTHTYTYTRKCRIYRSNCRRCCPTVRTLSRKHTHTLSLSLSHSLSHTHTHTRTHTHTHTHAYTHSESVVYQGALVFGAARLFALYQGNGPRTQHQQPGCVYELLCEGYEGKWLNNSQIVA